MLAHLSTTMPDPDGQVLNEMMRNASKIALCRECQNAYNYYAQQGRADEFYSAASGMLLTVQKEERIEDHR
jgi:hypothetical protein